MKTILLIAHLPPPVHGVSVISENILKSKILNSKYKLLKLNLSSSKSISQIGKNLFLNIYLFLGLLQNCFLL